VGEGHVTIATQWPVLWGPSVSLPEFLKRFIGASTVAVKSNIDVWSDRSLPPWIDPLIKQLESVLALKPGWDGAKANPITSDALEAALKVLEETMAWDTIAPAVVPVSDGGIQLEWHCAGVDLEVYVEPDGRVSAWCREGSREWEEDFYPRARLRKELSLLSSTFCQ
jgi:hypothetical protein